MGKNWAILIGINEYSFLQPLKFAKADAEAMYNWLRHQGGFEQIFLFTDDSPAITTNPPIKTTPSFGHLDSFFDVQFDKKLLKSTDNLWFFFSGHGNRGSQGDYLMVSDSNPRRLDKTAIPLNYITERLRNWGAGNVVMFIDACRNEENQGKGETISAEDYQGIITFYSCRDREKSREIESIKRGAFTHVLLQALENTKKNQGCLTVAGLEEYLMREVPLLNPNQHPLAKVEPTYKTNFILFGEAQDREIDRLKLLAYQKAFEANTEEAREILLHANMAAKGADVEIIDSLGRLSIISPPSPVIPRQAKPIETQPNSPIPREAEPIKTQPNSPQPPDEPINPRYDKLKSLLAAKQWKEADEETATLMLKIMNREEQGYLSEEDCRNFPPQELKIIDQLWVKYSQGHFGFSVQKQIWIDCGGTPGKWDYEVYKRFGDRVGWMRAKGEWKTYSELSYTTDSPQAHLPAGVGCFFGWFGGGLGDLFSLL